jgi:hypothetical protein
MRLTRIAVFTEVSASERVNLYVEQEERGDRLAAYFLIVRN